MFSGIVERLAVVKRIDKQGRDMRLFLDLGPFSREVGIDDSVSVNGVCLTAVQNGSSVAFDVMPETQEKTNLGSLEEGDRVNIELSMRPSDRLGGHFVLGHIDGTGILEKKEEDGRFANLWIKANPKLLETMIPKGSVALDGVSMTLVDVGKDSFSVSVIPHTLKKTTLGKRKAGETVNIEVDILGKYAKKLLNSKKRILRTA